ncbi:MBL fold metallo-hydrolase [Rubrimonas cliftonensis]|uniref:Hydroxyacylglutathione hydrolase n=1 Tax=Rubrimonas cliftonensis TaxID=89524 RepID=A0A1H3VDT9_9RHOB|nr:MBL fold metallo-hydrolase [Rubrimonas cliftonensis]SDZ72977.1 hydroxyacylglutathione hydrolase [Rubrimonas cliftonensis]
MAADAPQIDPQDAALLAGPEPFDRAAPAAGVPVEAAPGVLRIVAPNPSPMTFSGTATYVVRAPGGRGGDAAVIDPGPDDPGHRARIVAALAGAPARAVLVTHSHRDHSAGARALADALDAPLRAFGPHGAGARPEMAALAAAGGLGGGEGADAGFAPDAALAEGESVAGEGWRLTALHTPGHIANHLAFALEGTGTLFTGDVVMAWSTTLVSPPDGDMKAFLATLARLRRRGDRLLLPGHGAPVTDPDRMIAWQAAHRARRTRQILVALAEGPATAVELAGRLYVGLEPRLMPAAARNVLAHLLALAEDGAAECVGPLSARAAFRLA